MEPQSAPNPEQGSNPPKEVERTPLPEQNEAAKPTQEKLASKGETANQSAPSMPPVSLPKPVANDTNTDKPVDGGKSETAGTQDTTPAIADDVDVIEKEWVDKAKTIVDENKHDPYNQEKETSKLQADYLKKRFGKDVKLSP